MSIFSSIKNWFFADKKGESNNNGLTCSFDLIPQCTVLLTHGRTFLGHVIRDAEDHLEKTDDAWANHAGLYFGSGKHETIEAMPDGVVKQKLEDSMTADNSFELWAYRPLTVAQAQAIKTTAYAHVGEKYGYFDILRLAIKARLGFAPKINNEDKPICSQVVAEAYNGTGIKFANKACCDVTPDDIRDYVRAHGDTWYRVGSWKC